MWLSWYKGNSSFSSISVSDLSSGVSVLLKGNDQDFSIYSCVMNDSIRNKTSTQHHWTLWTVSRYISTEPIDSYLTYVWTFLKEIVYKKIAIVIDYSPSCQMNLCLMKFLSLHWKFIPRKHHESRSLIQVVWRDTITVLKYCRHKHSSTHIYRAHWIC